MSDLSMLIQSAWPSRPRRAPPFERRNPLDGSVATRAPAASEADTVAAVEAAAEAFKTWSSDRQWRALLAESRRCAGSQDAAVLSEAVPADRRAAPRCGRLQRDAGRR